MYTIYNCINYYCFSPFIFIYTVYTALPFLSFPPRYDDAVGKSTSQKKKTTVFWLLPMKLPRLVIPSPPFTPKTTLPFYPTTIHFE
jgi:hypothetical protein